MPELDLPVRPCGNAALALSLRGYGRYLRLFDTLWLTTKRFTEPLKTLIDSAAGDSTSTLNTLQIDPLGQRAGISMISWTLTCPRILLLLRHSQPLCNLYCTHGVLRSTLLLAVTPAKRAH
jgi:hypothetical protein